MNVIHLFRNLKFGGCQTLALSIVTSSDTTINHYALYLNEEDHDDESMKLDFQSYFKEVIFIDQKSYSKSEIVNEINSLITQFNIAKMVSWFYPYSLKLNIGCEIVHHAGMAALPKFTKQWFKNNIVFTLYSKIRKNDTVVYASEHILKSHHDNYFFLPKNKCVIYNGVDDSKFHFFERHRPVRKFIMIGRLDGSKDFDSYIKVANAVSSKYPVSFSIAGDGIDRERLEKINNSLEGAVSFLGTVKNLQISMSEYDSLIFLNKPVEGFGNVIVEAMLSGLLVVSNNLGASKEIISNGFSGILVDNIDELERVIVSVIEGRSDIFDMRKEARCIASTKFSSKKCAYEYNQLLRK